MAEEDQDKSLPASPFKLQEARKRGQVAKSLELNSWIILLTGLLTFYFLGEKLVYGVNRISHYLLNNAEQITLNKISAAALLSTLIDSLINLFWPITLVLLFSGIMATLIQIGPIFTFHQLKPDLKRLNPITGFKRLFSKRMLFEAFKTFIKLFLIILTGFLVIQYLLPKLLISNQFDKALLVPYIRHVSMILLITLVSLFFFIAILDIAYVRHEHAQKMRMSTREAKEEIKRREGDPHVIAKRKQLQKEYSAKLSSLGKVPNADFVVSNPEHIAVAIQYDRKTMPAPKVISKGADKFALKIKSIAQKHDVIIVENKNIARKLFYKININQTITPDLFPEVAKILLWVYSAKNTNTKSH